MESKHRTDEIMQRINTNTYIADRLVTCSEYQPFIDEMHEQGTYHQPDHWASLQFPRGNAHEPILGVRQSDATAFCEWLTDRDGEWKYRLPTSAEGEKFPTSRSPLNMGYWTLKLDGSFDFIWIGNAPAGENVLIIPDDYHRTPNRDIDLAIHLTQSLLEEMQSETMRLPLLLKLTNFLTLRERIAGRVPPYEGIRLVKEKRSL